MPTHPAKNSLPQLLDEIRACTHCEKHLPHGVRPVLAASSSSRILIVGQAPGLKVHESGIPWNDASGDRLREWMGLNSGEFYDAALVAIVPMGFCFPGTKFSKSGKSSDLPPRPECEQLWHRKLLPQLNAVELTLVVGAYAQKYMLGESRKNSLTETVSSWEEYAPAVIPLPHPSPRNNIWLKRNPWFEKKVLPFLRKSVAKHKKPEKP